MITSLVCNEEALHRGSLSQYNNKHKVSRAHGYLLRSEPVQYLQLELENYSHKHFELDVDDSPIDLPHTGFSQRQQERQLQNYDKSSGPLILIQQVCSFSVLQLTELL